MPVAAVSALSLLLVLAVLPLRSRAQGGVRIGSPGTAHPAAVLDLRASDRGLLIPRLDRQQRLLIPSPPMGLMVYQTLPPDSAGFWYFSGTRWLYLPDARTAALSVGATNGLTKAGTAVKLGGTLTEPTTLNAASQPLTISSTGQSETVDDQLNTSSPSPTYTPLTTTAGWQSFTPGVGGELESLELDLIGLGSYTLRIYQGEGIGGALLHTQNHTSNSGPVVLSLTAPVVLGSGQRYTFAVQRSSSTLLLGGYTTNTYAGGRNDLGAARDYYFATRMTAIGPIASTFTGGRLGVGTATPQTRLDVAGTTRTARLQVTAGAGTAGQTLLSDAGGNARWAPPPGDNLGTHGATQNIRLNGYQLVGAGSSGLYVSSTGLVGIGTTTPTTLLDVDGSVKLGTDGTRLTAIIRKSISLDVGYITQGTTRVETVTVPGASLGATVTVSPRWGRSRLGNATIAYARVSTADEVEIGFSSHESFGTNPDSQIYFITVIQ